MAWILDSLDPIQFLQSVFRLRGKPLRSILNWAAIPEAELKD